ncbi:MAG: hypothetical protein ABFR53_09670 [Actinomycetota bacterium]
MRISGLVVALLLVLGACSSGTEECSPAQTTSNAGEAQLETTDQFEAWSLWFTDIPANQPVRIPQWDEVKVVWSVTGQGDFTVAVKHSNGTVIDPLFGPQPHDGSNWDAPGDEWGTGWAFTVEGCWTFTVTRGSEVATLSVEVVS